MELHAYNSFPLHHQSQDLHQQHVDDIPSFEEAFNTESLKRFYQAKSQLEPLEITPYSFDLLSKAKNDDNLFDETSSQSTDERETQASPLIRYMSRFSQDTPLSTRFASNLNYQFYTEAEMSSEVQQECKSACQLPSEILQAKELFAKPTEGKRVFEMKGNLKMTMSFGGIVLKGAAQAPSMISRSVSQCSEESGISETSNFESLIRSKKIFKIQKEKPKVAIKQKSALRFDSGPSSPEIKVIKGTTIRLSKTTLAAGDQETIKTDNISFVNLINHETRSEQGLSIQMMGGRVLKL